MSDCFSGEGEGEDSHDDNRYEKEEEDNENYDNSYARKRPRGNYSPIRWRKDNLKNTPAPPPPPRPNNDAPNTVITLSNNTNMIRHTRYCTPTFEHYEYKVKNLGDLLALADYFNCEFDDYKKSNINLLTIAKLAPHIYELNSLVGMEQVKEQVLSMVLFFLQSLDDVNHDMLHSVIYGNPGVGKTRLIYILANIFATLGITDGVKVTFVKRADLVGQYLGQTAVKTKKVLEDARGGVLVIDEAYSLGDTEQRDSFSRECIDTLNQYLSECRRDLICVIAGYKADLENRFFKTNAGLKRRFAFQYEIPDYNANQLRTIFLQNVQRAGWSIEDNAAPMSFFDDNMCHFIHNGGSMELLFGKIKFEHARRIFSGFYHEMKMITREDMEAGMEQFLKNNAIKEKKCPSPPPFMMYT